ncbi:6-O-methylguanine DNA methyltransferase [Candidatus Kaiserbacteria bacterium CG10_big_fil_rev_8_21_14_0_10_45_20]|uniref:6-O-methylguanine DNA methyltransferase n=1 Tax=Candidatus Kaiserbacteria bacterium CG10_big_fil_rev_8_21_14_0_10_45_20 TaxID=1974607 RepID=A0A2H0UGK3_9BACT|nr:MAG: 6-O-methylguanine DNA methyltransferase [Candidatus Kaiserbacteria bacterium CG10_big_fil_rev_8_21_14_0_10_45_20]
MRKHCLNKKGTFRERVVSVVKAIPRGETLTYGEVALRAGHAKAARAVGAIMRTNTDKSVPCHRVVAKVGIGGYNGLKGKKKKLLREEGVAV